MAADGVQGAGGPDRDILVIWQADRTISAITVARGTSGHGHFNFIFSVISFQEVWVGRVTLPGTCRRGLHLAMAGKRLFWREAGVKISRQ